MAKVSTKKTDQTQESRKMPPALSPVAEENQLISLAFDMAREQLVNRTASSQVVTHFLKLATAKEQTEQQKMKAEVLLLEAKVEAIKAGVVSEQLYKEAISAMSLYSGKGSVNTREVDDYGEND